MDPFSVVSPIDPLLALALIFAAGYPAGLLARRVGIPSVTGNIVAGVLLGPSVAHVFDESVARDLKPLTMFAMGMMTVVIGGHLSSRRLFNAKRRIFSVLTAEVIATGTLVAAATWFVPRWFGAPVPWEVAVLLGAIAIATAPATILAVVREERAKGLLVKTLLASVALDNVVCIVLFSVAMAVVRSTAEHISPRAISLVMSAIGDIIMAAGFGLLVGFALLAVVGRRRLQPFSGLIIAIMLLTGGAQFLDISPLLACLSMGVLLGNSSREASKMILSLENLEPVVFTSFFTLAGVDLHLSHLPAMGLLGAAYFVARAVGKIGGGTIGAYIGTDRPRIRRYLGRALLPQAGLAIGLLVIIQGDPNISQSIVATITTVVLATVVLNELIGPSLVRRSLKKSSESHKDRARIVEFLQEEYILAPLQAEDRWGAIRQLAEFLIRSHGLRGTTADELVATVEERERSFTTALGSGVALPHARVEEGPEIMGVMGISPEGLDFDAPDGAPVNFVILIATPEEHQKKHQEVLAAVARIMTDTDVRAKLFAARNPAEAFDAIDTELEHDYNYFLED